MPASDRFTKLSTQVEKAQRNIEASAAEDKAQLASRVAEARKSADDHADQLRAKTQDASHRAEGQWHKIQGDWDAHVQRIRQRIDDKKVQLDLKDAENEADWAEADALEAVDFAAAAIEEAEYAVLDAAQARMDADALAAS